MTYELEFKISAHREWKKLGATVQAQFKKKLKKILEKPHIPGARLSGARNLYKIKLRQSGYRLVYKVDDQTITISVIAVGKRERSKVYRIAAKRLADKT